MTYDHMDATILVIEDDPASLRAITGIFGQSYNLLIATSGRDAIKLLQQPVDLIWGQKDPWEPVTEAQEWAKQFNCIQSLTILTEAGHCPHDENPEEVNKQLENILGKY